MWAKVDVVGATLLDKALNVDHFAALEEMITPIAELILCADAKERARLLCP
jgi:hypothetical protein